MQYKTDCINFCVLDYNEQNSSTLQIACQSAKYAD
jgi:hypothetical protein